MSAFDPRCPEFHGKPIWVVSSAYEGEGHITCAMLQGYDNDWSLVPPGQAARYVCIWGYSVFNGRPEFRTYGAQVQVWALSRPNAAFFASQEEAFASLVQTTTPSPLTVLPTGDPINRTFATLFADPTD